MRGNASRHQRANNDQPSHFSYRFEVTSLDPPRCRQQQQRPVRVTMLEICTSTTAIWMQIMTTAPRAARRKPLRTSGNSARAQGRIWAHSRVSFGSHPPNGSGTLNGHDLRAFSISSDVQELPSCLSCCRNALQSVEFDRSARSALPSGVRNDATSSPDRTMDAASGLRFLT